MRHKWNINYSNVCHFSNFQQKILLLVIFYFMIIFNSSVKVFLDTVNHYILFIFFISVVLLKIHVFYFHWFYFLLTFIPAKKFLYARRISETFLVFEFYVVKGNNDMVTITASTCCVASIYSFNISSTIEYSLEFMCTFSNTLRWNNLGFHKLSVSIMNSFYNYVLTNSFL